MVGGLIYLKEWCRGFKMKTFVAKVHYWSDPRLDPLMEERGGWIIMQSTKTRCGNDWCIDRGVGRGHQPYLKRRSQSIQRAKILPSNLERYVSSFLVREDAIVDTPKLLARILQPQAFPIWAALRELPFCREDAIVDAPKLPAPLLQPQAI